jgi:hypothetical protein
MDSSSAFDCANAAVLKQHARRAESAGRRFDIERYGIVKLPPLEEVRGKPFVKRPWSHSIPSVWGSTSGEFGSLGLYVWEAEDNATQAVSD